MAKYPVQIDTILTLPSAIDGTTPVAGYVVNRLRDAILQIENELGIKPSGIYATVRNRLDNLEASINNTDGAGALIVANIPLPGQDPIWTGSQWLAGGTPTPSPYGNPIVNNYLTADILTTGGIQAGPIQSTQLDTGLITLEGKLVANPISTSLVSNPNQGIIYYDGYTNQFLVSQNGGAYVPMLSTNMNVFTAGGDLSGTNTSQTVIGIQNVPVHSTTPTNNQVLTYLDGYWYAATSPAFPTIPTTLPPDGYAGGDLSGSYPNPTVAKINGVAVPSAGAGLTDGYVLTVTGTFAVSYATLNLSNPNTFTGILPAANQAPQTLSGQVSGPASATVVNKINGASVPPSGSLTPGYTLQVSGSNSLIYNLVSLNNGVQGSLPFANQDQQPMVGDVDGYTGANVVTAIQTIPVLPTIPTMGQFLGFDGYNWTPATLPPPVIPPAYPVGPAGGDLDGYYPNPGVAKIQGIPVLGTAPTDGQLLQYSDGYQAWFPSSVSGVFTAGGDLTGDASNQVVSGIQTIPVLAGTPADGQVLTYVAANSDWEPVTPTAVPTSLPPNGPATGDLGLTYPNPIVTGLQGNPISNAGPVVDDVLAWDGYAWNPQALEVTVTGPAGGDLDGYYPNPSVIKINGVLVTGTPVDGYVITATSPSTAIWAAAATGFSAGGDLSGTSTNQTVTGIQNIHIKSGIPSDGYVLTYVAADGYWEAVATAPTFVAGGDLSGTNTSQTVVSINGATVPVAGSLIDGYVLQVTGPSALSYAAINLAGGPNFVTGILPNINQAAQTMGGDVTGTTAVSTVTKLQNIAVKAGTPSDGYALIYVAANSDWEPVAISGSPTGAAGGDLGGTYPNPTIVAIDGYALPNPGPYTGLLHDAGGTLSWSLINLTSDVTGQLPTANQVSQSITLSGDITSTGGTTAGATTTLATVNADTGSFGSTTAVPVITVNAKGLITAVSTATLPTSYPPNGTAGGDLSGSYPNPTVYSIQGNKVQPTTLGLTQDGYVATWVNSDGYIEFKPTVVTTSVTMGGDISGNSASAIVAKLDGYALPSPTAGVLQEVGGALTWGAVNLASSTYVTGQLPTANQVAQSMNGAVGGTTAASTINLTGNTFITGILSATNQAAQTMLGDVTGTTSASTVIKIQGNAVEPITLSSTQDGYVATWINADGYIEFKPAAVTSFVTMTGDVTGTSNANLLSSIDGYALPNPGSHLGVLQSSGTALTWGPVNLASTTYVTGILPNTNQAAQTMGGAVGGTTAASTISLTSNANITGVLPAANQASQTMGGDVSGTTAASTVIKIQGNAIKPATFGASQDGYVLTWVNADGYIEAKPTATSLPPSGTAGGDLTGTYPNPTLGKIDGYALPSPTSGVLQLVGGSLGWGAINLASSSYVSGILAAANQAAQTMGGDVSGTTTASTVIKLQGNAIKPATFGASQDGYVLTWVNADGYIEAKPATTTTSVTLAGDVTGNSTTNVVSAISGSSPIAITPANLQWKSTTVSPTLSIATYSTTGSNAGTSLNITGQTGQNVSVTTLPGTVIVTNNSNAVTAASGTPFATANPTDHLVFANQPNTVYVISTVNSSTSINLTSLFTGSSTTTTVQDLGASTNIPNNNGGNVIITSGASGTGGAGTAPNGTPGNIILNIPAIGGYVQNQINGTSYMQFGENAGATGTIWLGASTPSTGSTNYALSGTSTNTMVNAPSGTLSLQVGGTANLTLNSTNVALPNILSAAFLKTDGSGNITAGTSLPVTNVTPGTSGQVLMTNATPATTWTTISGDITIGATGATTLGKIDGYALPNPGNNLGVLQSSGTALTWGSVNLASATFVTGLLPLANLTHGTAAQFLVTNSGATAPAWVSMSQDVAITAAGVATVNQLQGSIVLSGTPTSGQVLTATSGTAAHWATPSGGGGAVNYNVTQNTNQTTYTVASTDYIIVNDNTLTAIGTTFTVNNGQQGVTSASPISNTTGMAIVFGTDTVAYVVNSVTGGGNVSLTLTTPYQGTTGSVAAKVFTYYGGQYILPAQSGAGRAIVIKDMTGFAETNPINILPNASESADGVALLSTVAQGVGGNFAAVTLGSPTVTGTGTTFLTSVVPGNAIAFGAQAGVYYVVLTVNSNTSLTLTSNYTGTTANTSPGSSAQVNTLTYNTNYGSIQLVGDGVNWVLV